MTVDYPYFSEPLALGIIAALLSLVCLWAVVTYLCTSDPVSCPQCKAVMEHVSRGSYGIEQEMNVIHVVPTHYNEYRCPACGSEASAVSDAQLAMVSAQLDMNHATQQIRLAHRK